MTVGTRCRRARSSRRRRGDGASATATRSSPTTTSTRWPRHARGGCSTRSGLADVRVLDGGLRGWLAERLPLETGDVLPRPPGDVVLGEITDGIADIDGVEEWPDHGLLLDVRAPERYRGDAEPLDPVGGHIPGAVNLPTTVHLDGGQIPRARRDPRGVRRRRRRRRRGGRRPTAAPASRRRTPRSRARSPASTWSSTRARGVSGRARAGDSLAVGPAPSLDVVPV